MTDLRHKCTKPGQAYVALNHIKLLTASIDLNEKGIRTSKKVTIEIEHRRNLVSWITYTTNIDSLPNNIKYIICTKVHKTMLRANIPRGHLSFLKPIKKRNKKTDTDLSAWSQSSHRSKGYLSRLNWSIKVCCKISPVHNTCDGRHYLQWNTGKTVFYKTKLPHDF